MLALIQRVTHANVVVANNVIGEINQGILALIGIEKEDTEKNIDKLVNKLLGYRIFSDSDDKMNLNVQDIDGGLLLVPQFTLAADTKKGMRPSFSSSKSPDEAEPLFNCLVDKIKQSYKNIALGKFGADMKVTLVNDGPVTFMLQG